MKKTVSLLFLPLMICPMFLLITCSAKNVPTGNIVLANYESYINPDIEEAYGSEISFLYFSTDDDIMNKFQGNYDMAIPSFNTIVTLIKKG
jgi:hypothetical protein